MSQHRKYFLSSLFFLLFSLSAFSCLADESAVQGVQPDTGSAMSQAPAEKPAENPAIQKMEKAALSVIRDRQLLNRLQRDAFSYMWDYTFEESGLAYEDRRNKENGQATIGGTGFGICAIVAAAERGWITRRDYGDMKLTDEGRAIAVKVYERHRVLKQFLLSLGVNEEVAEHDCCLMEHIISDETFEAIKKKI